MMRLICITVCLLMSFSAQALSWQNLQTGLDYTKINVVYSGTPVNIHALKVNLTQLQVKPIHTPAKSYVKSMAISHDALVVINANFFDPAGKPLGLLVADQTELNPFKNISWWSVLCLKNNSAQIFHSSVYQKDQCDNAIQAGPRLVVQGAVPKLKENISKKSAVGLNTKGEFFIIVTENILPISLFAEVLRVKESEGGFELADALNLDGGSSTQIYVNTANFTLDIPNFVQVPVGLGVFPFKTGGY